MLILQSLSYGFHRHDALVLSRGIHSIDELIQLRAFEQWTLGGSFLPGSGEGSVAEIGILLMSIDTYSYWWQHL